VFARAVGFPNRIEAATDRLIDALDRGAVRRIGVGDAGGRVFLFHLGVGFDAAVVQRMEELDPRVKRVAAHPAFAVQTLRLLVRGFDRRTPAVHVDAPSGQNHDSYFTVVSNLAPYSFVGPRRMLLTADAGFDQALAVTSLTRLGLRDVAGAFGSSVGRARHLQRAQHVVQLRDVAHLRLDATRPGVPFPWQVDGDHLGTVSSLDVAYVPDSLSVVVPA
jgi:diacylglycerol kinase family enzyme